MRISNNGKYWVVQNPLGDVVAMFKSLKALTDYILITEQIIKMKNMGV